MIIHKDLTYERWFKFSVLEQLANVGCDVDRAIRWKNQGDLQASGKAFERALELLDFTKDDPKNRGPRLREICRVREALVDHFVYDNEYKTTDEFWQKYFFELSYAAALERGR